MSNIHDARELAYRLIRHARSEAGHTPLVHLSLSDAYLLEELLAREQKLADFETKVPVLREALASISLSEVDSTSSCSEKVRAAAKRARAALKEAK